MKVTGKLLALASALYLLIAPVPAVKAEQDNAKTIKIGVAGAHSGDLASYGLPTVKALELITKDVNAKGGINGRQVELLVEDDVCKPEIATNTATRLVSQGARFVVGHICSGATKAALPIYLESKTILISPSATNTELTLSDDYPNFFRTIAPDYSQAKTQVTFALELLGKKKIAIIHDKGDYGKGLAEYVKKFIEESKKAEIVLFEGVTPGAVDYSAIVQKIKRYQADTVIFGGYHPEASKIVSQLRKKRMRSSFISDDGIKNEEFIKIAGKYAEGVFATGPADVSANPITKAAHEAHKKIYGEDPGPFFDNAYAAGLALINAIEKAATPDYEGVRAALQKEMIDTPFGRIHFDEHGDATGVDFSIYQVTNGQFVEVN